jgi:hypothetical protein
LLVLLLVAHLVFTCFCPKQKEPVISLFVGCCGVASGIFALPLKYSVLLSACSALVLVMVIAVLAGPPVVELVDLRFRLCCRKGERRFRLCRCRREGLHSLSIGPICCSCRFRSCCCWPDGLLPADVAFFFLLWWVLHFFTNFSISVFVLFVLQLSVVSRMPFVDLASSRGWLFGLCIAPWVDLFFGTGLLSVAIASNVLLFWSTWCFIRMPR